MKPLAIVLAATLSSACVSSLALADGTDDQTATPMADDDDGDDGDYTLAQKKFIKGVERQFNPHVERMNQTCAAKVRASIDWKSWIGEVEKQIQTNRGTSIYGTCIEPIAALASMCSDEDAKRVIAKKVRAYTCKFGGEGKRSMALRKRQMTMWVDWKAKNNGDYIKKWIGDNL